MRQESIKRLAIGLSPLIRRGVARPGGIRVGILVHLAAVLESLQVRPGPIVSRVGLTLSQLENPDSIIPYATLDRLAKICALETDCPHFGLLMGERGGLETLGPLGSLIQHAPDVGTGLRHLVLYLHIHDCGAVPTLEVNDHSAVLTYSIYEPGIEAGDQIGDGAIAIVFNIMKSLCGPKWTPTEVILPRRVPADVRQYRRFYKAPIRFNSEHASLVFSADWLKHIPPRADRELHDSIQIQLEQALSKDHLTFAEQVRRVMRMQAMHRQASVESVAKVFDLHRRALGRRLKREGTSFEEILREVRFEIAKQLIADTDIPLTQIAVALDYSEPSALTRAFRKWSGQSPTYWRTSQRDKHQSIVAQ